MTRFGSRRAATIGAVLTGTVFCFSPLMLAAGGQSGASARDAAGPGSVAEAAMRSDVAAVRTLLAGGADVNAAQGDGMTALHWASRSGNLEMTRMLLAARANVRAATRLGAYTPLLMAAEQGQSEVIAALLAAGAVPGDSSAFGTTALMLAAASGNATAVAALVESGADVHAKELTMGQTALMFAAAAGRVDTIKALLARGADVAVTTRVVEVAGITGPEERPVLPQAREAGGAGTGATEARRGGGSAGRGGVDRAYRYNELIGSTGGMTALLLAIRGGYAEAALALLAGDADVNQCSEGDHTSPLLMATINGHFDLAMSLLDRGADPNTASSAGVAPLYAALNVQWAPRTLYPQPRAHQQQRATYLDVMRALIGKGANPNQRVNRKVWYSGYNFDLSGVDESGATPFWRAAYGDDVAAMTLLLDRGADPFIPTVKPAGRPPTGDGGREVAGDISGLPVVPIGGPGVTPLQAAAGVGYGEGFAANSHRHAPGGFLPAIRFLVEVAGADVNASDHEGYTALHHAAARGDNDAILYLVSKGADVTKLSREGRTVADMANGPVQRVQPFPETVALLEKLGSKNNHKCVSC